MGEYTELSTRARIGDAEHEALAPRLAAVFELAPDLPLFPTLEAPNGPTTKLRSRDVVNFAGYNYLGLNLHPEVTRAAADAALLWGTNSGGSRLVSGQSTLHDELEMELAAFLGVEAAVVFTSGYTTNETVLGHLLNPGDLAIVDDAVHNSILRGLQLSGARVVPFPHNDVGRCRFLLSRSVAKHDRILVILEGLYSMDGDMPDLPAFLELRERFGFTLMIDEAHSIGVLGDNGRGISERCGVDASEIDILMGTISKALGSSGGFIAGRRALTSYLQCTSPGFIFSGAPAPPTVAAALASLRVLASGRAPVARLRDNATRFRDGASARGIAVEGDLQSPIAPVIVPSWQACAKAAEHLVHAGVLVQPVIYPAVRAGAERLRFFVTSEHTGDQINHAVNALADALAGTADVKG